MSSGEEIELANTEWKRSDVDWKWRIKVFFLHSVIDKKDRNEKYTTSLQFFPLNEQNNCVKSWLFTKPIEMKWSVKYMSSCIRNAWEFSLFFFSKLFLIVACCFLSSNMRRLSVLLPLLFLSFMLKSKRRRKVSAISHSTSTRFCVCAKVIQQKRKKSFFHIETDANIQKRMKNSFVNEYSKRQKQRQARHYKTQRKRR